MGATAGLATIGVSALVFLALLGLAFQHRKSRVGRWFLGFLACALVWAIGYFLELVAVSFWWKLLWAKVQYIGIVFVPVAWLRLITTYLGVEVPPAIGWALGVEPVVSLVLAWGIPRPNPFWGNPSLLDPSATVGRIDYDYGWWFYSIHVPHGYLLMLASVVVLVRAMIQVNRQYRAPLALFLVAVLLPAASDVAYVAGFAPFSTINPATMVMSVSGLLIGLVLHRYRFPAIVPIARSVVFETMTDAVMVVDAKGNIVDVNPAAMEVFRFAAPPIGAALWKMGDSALCEALLEMADSGDSLREVHRHDPGALQPAHVYEIRMSPLADRGGERSGAVFTLREVTERVRLYERVRELSMHDDLTGTHNRRFFMDAGEREIDRARRDPSLSVGVLLVDLDDFKTINDRYGHAAGDAILTSVASVAHDTIRGADVLGRLGGDEFAVLLPGAGEESARNAAERLRVAVDALSVDADGHTVSVTTSVGFATTESFAPQVPSLERLLRDADQSMYRAKRAGKNRVGE